MRSFGASVQIIAAVLCVIATLVAYTARRHCTTQLPSLDSANFDCYVINMAADRKRMQGFLHAYMQCDLSDKHSLIRHDATVGKSLQLAEHVSPKALSEILRAERNQYRQKHYELTRGGVGCYLSHVHVWKKVLESDKTSALIFEDDCVMAQNTESIIKKTHVPHDWDICLLGYVCNDCHPSSSGCHDVLSVQRFFGLHCYMIRTRAIRKILANPKTEWIHKQIDAVLSDMIRDKELVVYALPTPVAWQNNTDHPTTIQMQLKRVPGVDEWADT